DEAGVADHVGTPFRIESVRPATGRDRPRRFAGRRQGRAGGATTDARRAQQGFEATLARSRRRVARVRCQLPRTARAGATARDLGQGRAADVDDGRVVAGSSYRWRPLAGWARSALPGGVRSRNGPGRPELVRPERDPRRARAVASPAAY